MRNKGKLTMMHGVPLVNGRGRLNPGGIYKGYTGVRVRLQVRVPFLYPYPQAGYSRVREGAAAIRIRSITPGYQQH